MEYWGHVTIVREIIKGRNSPVTRQETRGENIRQNMSAEKLVSKGQPPHVEEQSRSKVSVLQRQERIHEKGKKL